MIVLILEGAPQSLKGELSRWLMEPKSGVFLGHVSALVREALWKKCVERIREGSATLIYSWPTEQGFRVQVHGIPTREIIDNDGLYLVRKPAERFPVKFPPELTRKSPKKKKTDTPDETDAQEVLHFEGDESEKP